MNILPLVFAFLLIFSYITASFVRENKSSALIEWTLHGYNHIEKAVRNGIIKRAFDHIKASETSCPVPKDKNSKTPSFISRRISSPPLETSKFYLRAFANTSTTLVSHPLYEPLATLLRNLYQERVFKQQNAPPGVEYTLIPLMIQKMNDLPSSRNLADLMPSDPFLQNLYYKMLRGTNRYSLQEGIPPLSHFLSLEKSDKVIHLNHASEPILEALFGGKITKEILEKEKQQFDLTQKYYAFSKQDFEILLEKHTHEKGIFFYLNSLISYTKKVGKKEHLAKRDKITQIGIEKEL